MARLPIYTQKYQLPVGPRARASDFAAGQIGEALSTASTAAVRMGEEFVKREEDKDKYKAKMLIRQLELDEIKDRAAREESVTDYNGYVEASQTAWDERVQSALAEAGLGKAGSEYLREKAADLKTSFLQQDIQFAAVGTAKNTMEDFKNDTDVAANVIALSPDRYDEYYLDIDEEVSFLPGNDRNRKAYADYKKNALTLSYQDALLARTETPEEVDLFIKNFSEDKRTREDLDQTQFARFLDQANNRKATLANAQTQSLTIALDNEKTRLSAGKGASRIISDDQIRAAYPNNPQYAAAKIADMNLAYETGQIRDNIAMMGPTEIAEMVKKQQADVSDPAKQSALEATQFGLIQRMIQERNQRLVDDSVSYVTANDPVVKQAYDRYEALTRTEGATIADVQAALNDYVVKSKASQGRLGVTSATQRILTNTQVDALTAEFTAPEVTGDVIQQKLTSMRNLYGQNWPQVYRELAQKLPDETFAIADMLHDQAAGKILASLTNQKVNEMVPGGETEANNIKLSIISNTQNARSVYMQSPIGSNLYTKKLNSTMKLAAYYMGQGKSQSDAVEIATQNVFGGYLYAPTFAITATNPDAQYLVNTAPIILEQMPDDFLPEFDVPQDIDRAAMLRAIKSRGYFVNGPPGTDSLMIKYERFAGTGDMRFILQNDQPLQIKYDDLATAIVQVGIPTLEEEMRVAP